VPLRARLSWLYILGAGIVLALGGCSSPHASTTPTTARRITPGTTPVTTTTARTTQSMFTEAFNAPAMTITSSGTYLSWWLSPEAFAGQTELARVDVTTGQILARRQLGEVMFRDAVSAGGSLWVTTVSESGGQLLRLAPTSLRLIARWRIGAGWEGDNLALAGRAVWVDGGSAGRFLLRARHLLRQYRGHDRTRGRRGGAEVLQVD